MDGEPLVLYRQSIAGEWRVYRNSGFQFARWRQVLATRDEGKAEAIYEAIHDKLRQGGVRLMNPEGRVIKEFNPGANGLRWGERYRKPKRKAL